MIYVPKYKNEFSDEVKMLVEEKGEIFITDMPKAETEINGKKVEKLLVNDKISVTKQSMYHGTGYYGTYTSSEKLEIGKLYHIIINEENFETLCIDRGGKPTLYQQFYGYGIIIEYDEELNSYLISYYSYDMQKDGDNPTVNFELYEVKTDELLIFNFDGSIYDDSTTRQFTNMSYDEIMKKKPTKGYYIRNEHLFGSIISITYDKSTITVIVNDSRSSNIEIFIRKNNIELFY